MSRFADVESHDTVDLGPCECPDKPHVRDEAVIRRELPYSAEGQIGRAGMEGGGGETYDFIAAKLKLVELGTVSWNLHGPNGKEWPVSAVTVRLLNKATVEKLAEALNDRFEARATLPNASAAPSPAGSRVSGSRTRATKGKRSSTTSS